MRQRCVNSNNRSYRNYGGRGIEFRFASVRDAVRYIQAHLPHETYLGLDIDRIDNSGHYAPGNLRLVTRAQNLRNKRGSKVSDELLAWAETSSPYALNTTLCKLRNGITREQIIAEAMEAVSNKRKAWRTILANLERLGHTTF